MAKKGKTNHKRLLGLFILFLLTAAVVLTVIISQQQTQEKSSAAFAPPGDGSSLSRKPPCKFRFVNDVVEPPGYGDVNGDGNVNSVDALLVNRIVARLPVNIPQDRLRYAYEAGDVNGQPYKISYRNDLDSSDALMILRYAAKLDNGFAACHYTTGLFIVK